MSDTLITSEENRLMFDSIARRYDLLNAVISLGQDGYWRRQAVGALDPQDGQIFLDVGCGTGDVAMQIVRQAGRARVIGVDPAEAMLKIADEKAVGSGMDDCITYRPADVTDPAEEFPEAPFDGVTCAFCIRNITDRAAALERMVSVMRPGGRVAILELTRPAGRLVRFGHKLYNRLFVPLVGKMLSRGGAYKYLVRSIENFPQPQAICEAMEAAGFVNVKQTALSGGVVTLFTGNTQ
ncbi:MAG: ubiquinone/menaquinone biosynthesis methyltransferase [Phycisphaerales bacterium]|jgi:demethylmenaquinone methyltransferase / 2-methoxy-6-polyprenyl-1,4-benzoquinol methylase|nr:ubiquinone/menaquinone biosynthesis methyltransferase [Phycisphaerales bacterium]